MGWLIKAKINNLLQVRNKYMQNWGKFNEQRDSLRIYQFWDRKMLHDQMLITQGIIDGLKEAIRVLNDKSIR